ncbi:MAG: AAA family ATPase [Opitutales bacterium]|nr:AAA family ATPase [Opitutales bacterium]MBT7864753.1 AAA family ATPase [Opitutales bacterium]MDG2254712.1 AAA family ATPase [Opitutaceae bacterium]
MTQTPLKTRPENTKTNRIFVAATRMNDGKTTTCLGLFGALQDRYKRVGFIKPVGQRFVKIEGQLIDEDSVLLEKTYKVQTPIASMSPIAIDSSFTKRYLDNPIETGAELTHKVCSAFDQASWEKDLTIIEGSGHAGVGSVFNMSNARVAKLLGAKAIIISRGGIGRPIDEIALNKALFDKEGVEVIGAIINKVQIEKMDYIRKYTSIALESLGIPLLGLLPVEKILTSPNLRQIFEQTGDEWLHEIHNTASRRVSNIIIGAMTAPGFLNTITPGTLLITPGDREDIIMAALSYEATSKAGSISGIVLTRGITPHPRLIELIRQSSIPVIIAEKDSYVIASRLHGMTVKTQPDDTDKIPLIQQMILENIDLKTLEKSF